MREKPRVAIFILNYNSSGFLHLVYRSVESALNINYDNLDVVFIDNNSTDGSYEAVLDRFRGDAIFIKLRKNYGYTGGNELGFRRYALEKGLPGYAIFMNNDYVTTNEDSVGEIINYMEGNRRVVLAGGYTLTSNSKRILEAGNFIDIFNTVLPRLENLSLDEAPEKPSYISYPTGAFLVCKVKPILEIRGLLFRPEIFSYWDETELASSLWTHGLYSVSLPTEVGIHHISTTFSKYSTFAAYMHARNGFAFLESYWRDHTKLYVGLAKLSFMQRAPLMILQGRRGAASMRGFIDSRDLRFPHSGRLYPLIIKPKRIGTILKRTISPIFRFRILRKYYDRIINLIISEENLRSSPLPYMIPIDS